jgi:hypothetical protein
LFALRVSLLKLRRDIDFRSHAESDCIAIDHGWIWWIDELPDPFAQGLTAPERHGSCISPHMRETCILAAVNDTTEAVWLQSEVLDCQ